MLSGLELTTVFYEPEVLSKWPLTPRKSNKLTDTHITHRHTDIHTDTETDRRTVDNSHGDSIPATAVANTMVVAVPHLSSTPSAARARCGHKQN